MFIFTTKFTRKKAIIIVLIIAAILCSLVFLAGNRSTEAQAADLDSYSVKGIENNKDRIAFLEGYGWSVYEEPIETLEVTLPEDFDETYARYNALQQEQGFDLSVFAGKRVKRYTYEITNYPTGEIGILAHLVLYKNRVIAGDVCSPELNGFMHGLTMPES